MPIRAETPQLLCANCSSALQSMQQKSTLFKINLLCFILWQDGVIKLSYLKYEDVKKNTILEHLENVGEVLPQSNPV